MTTGGSVVGSLYEAFGGSLRRIRSQEYIGHGGSALHLAAFGMVVFVVALCVDVLYNLYINRLATFPGPRLCAISRVPQLLWTVSGKQVTWLVDLHEHYGGVVRIAPDTLSFTDERAWNDICSSTKYAIDGMAKDPRLAKMIGGDLTSPDPTKPRREQAHGIMRRAMAPALKGSNVKRLESTIDKHMQEWLLVLATDYDAGRASDMCDSSSFLMCNLFFDLFLGQNLDLHKKETFRPWVHSFDRFARGVTILAVLNRFPLLHQPLLFAVRRWGGKERDSFMQPILERFDRRMSMETRPQDMLQTVLEDDDHSGSTKGHTMPVALMREFIPFLILGACDPIPVVMAGFVFFVFRSQNAKIRERLLAEVRGAFRSDKKITLDDLAASSKDLQYFEACLQETFRCYSPGATGTDRVVPAPGAEIAGRFVPEGTVVVMQHQPTYMMKQHFARANEFVPDRWLSADAGRPSEFENDRRDCMHPFSVGPAACLGQEMTFYVLRLALCKLLYRFDIDLAPGYDTWIDEQVTFSVRVKPPLLITVKPTNLGM